MPRFVTSLVRAQIALLNPLLKRMDIKAIRKLQDALGALGTRVLADGVTYEDEIFPAFEASWAMPAEFVPGKAILYLHGGAYTAGSLTYARLFGGVLAEKTGHAALCVGYRLAPEDPHPAAVEDALCSYRRLLEDHAPEDISLVGESAGGGLCYCLCLKLRELGLPQPARIVALSPWTDLTMDRVLDERAANDPILNVEKLRYSASLYAGDRVREPTVSPIFGDVRGLPPSLIMVGSDEVLLQDSVSMAEHLGAHGCTCELHIAPDMWHAYMLYGIPEAKEALDRIRAYILRKDEENDDAQARGLEDPAVDQAR